MPEGEIGADGRVHGISVCPSPYTKPYPPVFVASNASQQTIEYAGDKDFIPAYFSSIKTASRFGAAYVEHAAKAVSAESPTAAACSNASSRLTRYCTRAFLAARSSTLTAPSWA